VGNHSKFGVTKNCSGCSGAVTNDTNVCSITQNRRRSVHACSIHVCCESFAEIFFYASVVDTDTLDRQKQASTAFWRWHGFMLVQQSTVNWSLAHSCHNYLSFYHCFLIQILAATSNKDIFMFMLCNVNFDLTILSLKHFSYYYWKLCYVSRIQRL